MAKFRVEFVESAEVAHAHTGKDAGKGGYRREVIPKGTIVEEMTSASVNYWNARGKIKVLGRVDEPALSAFGVAKKSEGDQVPAMSKASLRGLLETAHQHLERGDEGTADLESVLASLDPRAIAEPLEPLSDDSKTVLFCAIDDAKAGGPVVGIGELSEVLLDAADVLLAPSKRKRVKPSSAPE